MNEKLLNSFYKAYHEENYIEAISILKTIRLNEEKEDFWINSRLSSCYYELKDYDKALFYIQIAYSLRPESPLVLWDYASVLIMMKKEEEAIKLLEKLQSMSNDLTVYEFSDPDSDWMIKLKNDTNFLLGKAYYTIYKDELAKNYLLKFINNIDKGIDSIYSKNQALKYINEINSD